MEQSTCCSDFSVDVEALLNRDQTGCSFEISPVVCLQRAS